MPATSDKQERFMQAVAHNPKFAKKVGVKQKVGKEFVGMADGGDPADKKPKSSSNFYRDAQLDAIEKHGIPPPVKELPPGSLAKEGLTAAEKAKRAAGPPKGLLEEHYRKKAGGSVGFAKGGSIDGCAQRGKTRGKVV